MKLWAFIFTFLIMGSSVLAQDATGTGTTSPPPSLVITDADGCTHNHNIDELLSDRRVILAQCTPMAMAIGVSMGSAFAKKAAATRAGAAVANRMQPYVDRAAERAAGKLAGKLAIRAVASLNIIGIGITAVEIMKVLAGLTAEARDCQLYEHDLKKSVYDEMDERGRLIQEALEDAGFELTEQQKRQLRVPAPKRDRIQTDSCGDVNLYADYLNGRQNKVYGDIVSGTMAQVPFPEVPKYGPSEWDQQMAAELYEDLNCMETEEAIRAICAIGNMVLLGKEMSHSVLSLRRTSRGAPEPRVPTLAQIKDDRKRFFTGQLMANLNFPQDPRAIKAYGVGSVLKNDASLRHYFHEMSEDEIEHMVRAANNAHAKHAVGNRVTPKSAGRAFRYSLEAANQGTNTIRLLAFNEVRRGGNLLTPPPPRRTPVSIDNYRTQADTFDNARNMQTPQGRAYLQEVGDTINSTLRSPEMRDVARRWKNIIERSRTTTGQNQALRAEFQAVQREYDQILTNGLLARFPHLNTQVHISELRSQVPGVRLVQAQNDPVDTRSMAGWIVYSYRDIWPPYKE